MSDASRPLELFWWATLAVFGEPPRRWFSYQLLASAADVMSMLKLRMVWLVCDYWCLKKSKLQRVFSTTRFVRLNYKRFTQSVCLTFIIKIFMILFFFVFFSQLSVIYYNIKEYRLKHFYFKYYLFLWILNWFSHDVLEGMWDRDDSVFFLFLVLIN